MGRILAIDYGRKRSGLAVTDENRLIAGPMETVSTHDLLRFLIDYCQVETVDCFVVGEPRQMNGKASESAVYIEPFIKSLKKQLPHIPVNRIDERFTSKMASQAIAHSGLKKKDRQNKALIDQVSAVLILQSFMESNVK